MQVAFVALVATCLIAGCLAQAPSGGHADQAETPNPGQGLNATLAPVSAWTATDTGGTFAINVTTPSFALVVQAQVLPEGQCTASYHIPYTPTGPHPYAAMHQFSPLAAYGTYRAPAGLYWVMAGDTEVSDLQDPTGPGVLEGRTPVVTPMDGETTYVVAVPNTAPGRLTFDVECTEGSNAAPLGWGTGAHLFHDNSASATAQAGVRPTGEINPTLLINGNEEVSTEGTKAVAFAMGYSVFTLTTPDTSHTYHPPLEPFFVHVGASGQWQFEWNTIQATTGALFGIVELD